MILAGYETTANTLAACLALLALHEEIQDEVFEEILSIVGRDEDPVRLLGPCSNVRDLIPSEDI
jgi:cytochrome P450